MCVLCGDECESGSHCSAHRSIRAQFLLKLQARLGVVMHILKL